MTLGYIALSLFTSLSFFRRNPLHNLSFNGLISMLSIAMALASAYGAFLPNLPFPRLTHIRAPLFAMSCVFLVAHPHSCSCSESYSRRFRQLFTS
jgi:hypothetical protein